MEAIGQGRRRIVVVGMGHVGGATAAWLLRDGHEVVAIEADAARRALLESGARTPPYAKLAEALVNGRREGRLAIAAALSAELLEGADALFVCVGTPATAGGDIDTSQVLAVTRAIAAVSHGSTGGPRLIVYRSTMPVGTTDRSIRPLLEGLGPGIEIASMPEFLREAHALEDALAPTRIVLGERERGATRRLHGLLAGLAAPVFEVDFRTAELAKLVDNGWHALKVTFANEVGRLADSLGLDAQPIEDILIADRRLNLSAAYLRHGMPFGGSCIPKDMAALAGLGARSGARLPTLASILHSNGLQMEHVMTGIERSAPPPARIMLLGLSLGGNPLNLRESPLHSLARNLLDRGYELRIVDPELTGAALHGADPDVATAYSMTQETIAALSLGRAGFVPDLVVDGLGGTVVLPDGLATIPRWRVGHS